MIILRKSQIGPTNGKCLLILINVYKPGEIIISGKTHMVIYPPAIFNNMPVVWRSCQNYLGIYLDEKLNFSDHIKEKISKANKGI